MNITIPVSSLKCLVGNALLFAASKGNLAVVRFCAEPVSLPTSEAKVPNLAAALKVSLQAGIQSSARSTQTVKQPSLVVVATDGYVLSVERSAAEVTVAGAATASLAVADAKALLKTLPAGDEKVSVTLSSDKVEFSAAASSASYSAATQPFPPWATWLERARRNAAAVPVVSLAPQLLAKVGRADPYGGQGKPAGWDEVASVQLQMTMPPEPVLWAYGEHLHGLVKPLTNVTLAGEEMPDPRGRKKKPLCPECGRAELIAGRKLCQACALVVKLREAA